VAIKTLAPLAEWQHRLRPGCRAAGTVPLDDADLLEQARSVTGWLEPALSRSQPADRRSDGAGSTPQDSDEAPGGRGWAWRCAALALCAVLAGARSFTAIAERAADAE
jgi:hypothetical protein